MLSIKETDFFLEIDDVLRSKIEQALHNFDQLQKDRKYQLSFSGGKDSHALLAIYSLYLKIEGQPLDLVVSFSDTHLENDSLYLAIERAEEYCESIGIPSKTAVTLFSGGGLADIGLKKAGFTIIGAVERDTDIAEVYRTNHGDHIVVGSVFDVDYRQWRGADLLHASPPCQAFSIARSKSLPEHEGKDAGYAVIRAIDEIQPRWVTIENVEGYKKSKVYADILAHLWANGYWVVDKVVNAKYHGVPQSRKRLIMVASKSGMYSFPPHEPIIGWYEVIADLLPDCQNTELAKWQKERLNEFSVTCLINEDSKLKSGVAADNPSPTVMTTGSGSAMRAVLLPRGGARKESFRPIAEDEPAPTLKAMAEWGGSHVFDAMDGVTIKKLSPRCLARLMSVPDDYVLPSKIGLAVKVLGNGVPPEMMYRIAAVLR